MLQLVNQERHARAVRRIGYGAGILVGYQFLMLVAKCTVIPGLPFWLVWAAAIFTVWLTVTCYVAMFFTRWVSGDPIKNIFPNPYK